MVGKAAGGEGRDPGRARLRAVLAVLAVVVPATGGTLLAVACLPELPPIAEPEPPEAGGTSSGALSTCGDGVIATNDDGSDAGESCDPGEAGAGTPGCTLCHLTCEGVIDPASDHCYFDAGPTDSYVTALQRCDDVGAHIVTVASDREARLVGDAGAWIGLAQSPNVGGAYLPTRSDEPGYPCPGCYGLRSDDAGPTGPFSPLAPTPSPGGCVVTVGGRWFAVPCEDAGAPYATVCEREPVGRRGHDCNTAICFTLPKTSGTKRYVLFTSADSPETAQRTCAQYSQSNGALALLDSAEEREQLAREVAKFLPNEIGSPAPTIWIGLAFDPATSTWRWEDGEPAEGGERPVVWGVEQPKSGGVGRAFLRMKDGTIDAQLAIAEGRTDAARPFVCQRAP